MLTIDTQIPTHARGQVRALVKAHKSWPAYLAGKDIISANAKNADLIEFALMPMHAELAAQIATILDAPVAAAQPRVWRPEQIEYLTAAIEHLLSTVKTRKKVRVRRQAGRAA